jgi:putative heme-binding domain-containing protein
LAGLQSSKSDWHARRARVVLQSRATKRPISASAVKHLTTMYKDQSSPDYRLRAMWSLHITENLSEQELIHALSDKDEYVRAWAIQMLCEDMDASKVALTKMKSMSQEDNSAVVRLYLAAALQRVSLDSKWELTSGLIAQNSDVDDHNIPKMIWFAMEDLVEQNPEKGIATASASKIPIIAEFAARRLVDADELELLVESLGQKPLQAKAMLSGMIAGLEGRSDLKAPANWKAVYDKLKSNRELSESALEVAQLFGDTEAAQQYLRTLKNPSANIETRKEALKSLASRQRKELIPILPTLMKETGIKVAAIRAMAAFEDESFGLTLIEDFQTLNATEKGEALQTLSSRTVYGRLLAQAIRDEHIKKSEIPAYVARQLRRVVGNGFVEIWGPIDQLSGDKSLAYRRYRHLLTEPALAKSNLVNGKRLFESTCSACHTMYNKGGNIGPDITGSNRTNVEYLLSNLIEPSGEIQDDYKMVVVTSRDGRTYIGNIISENERQITMRVIGQDELVLNKSDIQSQETSANSMMPEGLLQTMTDQEVLDLISYLKNPKDVSL